MTRNDIEQYIQSPRIKKAALSKEEDRTPADCILILVYGIAGKEYVNPTERKVEQIADKAMERISETTPQEEGLKIIRSLCDEVMTSKARQSPLWTPQQAGWR